MNAKKIVGLYVLPNVHSTKAYLLRAVEKWVSFIRLVSLLWIWVLMILHYVNVLTIGLNERASQLVG